MNANGPALERLPDAEWLRLIASVPVGRIVYTLRALPAVEPVNFAVHDGDVVFRTEPGGKVAAAVRQAVVAFEVDELDFARRAGWSVTIVGTAREVTDPADEARLGQLGLSPWAPGEREHFVRITPGIITGRWLHHAFDLGDQAVLAPSRPGRGLSVPGGERAR
jgi:nitroimidazol reductase NimA-like FMN-containing flavoprotein (pyridoxamine 5'-phosphate oxidase superfamily)